MALSTLDDLKAAVAEWMERSDLTPRIPDFITLAESRLNRLFRGRMNEVSSPLTATPGQRTLAVPALFSEAITLWLLRDGGRQELRFVDPGLIDARSAGAQPQYWTVEGATIAFDCTCDQAYPFTLRHLKKFQLSEAEPTNALLADYPDLYLFGTLLEAAPFLRDADLLGLFQTRYDTAMTEATDKEHSNRSHSSLRSDRALLGSGRYDIRRG